MIYSEIERPIVFSCLVGSHNYCLNTEQSDKDYKVFTVPTFDDLYFGQFYSKSKTGMEFDFDSHDIRKLPDLLWKANINFLETLFSNEYWINSTYEKIIYEIISSKDEIARMNLPYLWNACIGMFHTQFSKLEKGTEGTQYLVNQFGYDTKQALHCYRALDFLERFQDNRFRDFKGAIQYNDSPQKDFLINIKSGCYSLLEFVQLVEGKKEKISSLKEEYKTQPVNHALYSWLKVQIKRIVHNSLNSFKKEEL